MTYIGESECRDKELCAFIKFSVFLILGINVILKVLKLIIKIKEIILELLNYFFHLIQKDNIVL